MSKLRAMETSVTLGIRTSQRVLALVCAGRTPEQVAAQVGVPVALVRRLRTRAGWPSVMLMREEIARLDARAQGRALGCAPAHTRATRDVLAGLDQLVTAVSASSDPAVIDALVDLQLAAARVRRAAAEVALRGRRRAS